VLQQRLRQPVSGARAVPENSAARPSRVDSNELNQIQRQKNPHTKLTHAVH